MLVDSGLWSWEMAADCWALSGWGCDGVVPFICVGVLGAARVEDSWRARARAAWMLCIVRHQTNAATVVVMQLQYVPFDHEWLSLPIFRERPICCDRFYLEMQISSQVDALCDLRCQTLFAQCRQWYHEAMVKQEMQVVLEVD